MLEQNPLCSSPVPEPSSEDAIPDHCRPLSPDRDRLATSEDPSPSVHEASAQDPADGDGTKEDATFPEGGQEPPCAPPASVTGQTETEPQYTSEARSNDSFHMLPSFTSDSVNKT